MKFIQDCWTRFTLVLRSLNLANVPEHEFFREQEWDDPGFESIPKEEPIPESKLFSLSYAEVLCGMMKRSYGSGNYIVLTNVNLSAKNLQFWAKVPKEDMPHFFKDVIVMRCKDKSQMLSLISNIGPDFAEAMGFSAGELVTVNTDSIEVP